MKQALRIGEYCFTFETQNEDFHALDRKQKNVVIGTELSIRTGQHVIARHGKQIGTGINDSTGQRGIGYWCKTHRGKAVVKDATDCAVTVGVQGLAIIGRQDCRAIDVDRDSRCAGQRVREEEPRKRIVLRCHDRRSDFLPGAVGGVEIVVVESRGIDCLREIHLWSEGRSDFARFINWRKARDIQQRWNDIDIERKCVGKTSSIFDAHCDRHAAQITDVRHPLDQARQRFDGHPCGRNIQ